MGAMSAIVDMPRSGGIVKRSLAMVLLGCAAAIAKAFGLDAATHTVGLPVIRIIYILSRTFLTRPRCTISPPRTTAGRSTIT